MPKLYFTDPGLAANPAGIQDPKQVNYHSLKGGLFESMIVSELLKYRFNRAKENNLTSITGGIKQDMRQTVS